LTQDTLSEIQGDVATMARALGRAQALSNKPMKLTVSPQGHRSIIERPASAAGPQLIGKAFDGRYATPCSWSD
jgi:hypothetical protein